MLRKLETQKKVRTNFILFWRFWTTCTQRMKISSHQWVYVDTHPAEAEWIQKYTIGWTTSVFVLVYNELSRFSVRTKHGCFLNMSAACLEQHCKYTIFFLKLFIVSWFFCKTRCFFCFFSVPFRSKFKIWGVLSGNIGCLCVGWICFSIFAAWNRNYVKW